MKTHYSFWSQFFKFTISTFSLKKKIKYIHKKFIKQQKKETKNVKIIIVIIRQETLIRKYKKDYGCVYKNVK